MVQSPRAVSIKAMARQKAQDYLWGIPESPEFSAAQRVIQEFQAHENDEGRWLSLYQRMARETDDPLVRFLFNLIIADEERHREILDRMVAKLRDEMASTHRPRVAPKWQVGEKKEKSLLEVVERLLSAERNWLKEHERLTQTSEGFRHDVFALLFRTMVHDTHKHIGILDFLRLRLRRAQTSARRRKK